MDTSREKMNNLDKSLFLGYFINSNNFQKILHQIALIALMSSILAEDNSSLKSCELASQLSIVMKTTLSDQRNGEIWVFWECW